MDKPLENFYELNEERRLELAERAIAERRTLYERWTTLNSSEASPWRERTALAVKLLGTVPSVADMGCGTMALESFLPAGVAYFPVDVVARDKRTTICDFNREEPPRLEAATVVCLGLIEYLFDAAQFLTKIAEHYKVGVVSYNVEDGAPLQSRRQHGWVNDYRLEEIEALFAQCGWRIEKSVRMGGNQILWRLLTTR